MFKAILSSVCKGICKSFPITGFGKMAFSPEMLNHAEADHALTADNPRFDEQTDCTCHSYWPVVSPVKVFELMGDVVIIKAVVPAFLYLILYETALVEFQFSIQLPGVTFITDEVNPVGVVQKFPIQGVVVNPIM